MKTMEIERAVVRVEYVQQARPQVSDTAPIAEKAHKEILTQEALLAALRAGEFAWSDESRSGRAIDHVFAKH